MKIKYIGVILVLLLLVLVIGCGNPTTPLVIRVIDGDTIEVNIAGESYKVRYIGIDTPELDDERAEFCALAQEATRYNRQLVEGKTIRLERDISESDRYGRISPSWRYPKGIDNKPRKKRKGWPVQPGVGYGNPRVLRGLHPSGLKDHLVHRPEDLVGLDPDEDGIRIATTVGMRKRLAIRDKADEIGLVIFNPSRFDMVESEMDLGALEDEVDEDLEPQDLDEDKKKSKKRKSKK